jgi:transcriptional regulator with XRE-family HTH domain
LKKVKGAKQMSVYYTPTKEEIRRARLDADLTQAQCAHMCLVKENSWSRYEQGVMKMSPPVWKLFGYAVAHKQAEDEMSAFLERATKGLTIGETNE